MKFRVYEEELHEVCDEAIPLLAETRNQQQPMERFDWLYRNNPDGNAVFWSIRDSGNGEMAGFTVALPRRMRLFGRTVVCWNTADFSIRKKYRTLGVALKLRRAAKEGVDAKRVEFLYAHPNERMQVIHERVGHTAIGTMIRSACPLQSISYLQERLPGTLAPRLMAPLADAFLHWRNRPWQSWSQIETTVVKDITFDDTFSVLFEQITQFPIMGIRDRAYLTWRYAENPLYRTHAILAKVDGQLVGYILFTVENGVFHMKDVLWHDHSKIANALVSSLLKYARTTTAKSVSFVAMEGHPLASLLAAFGFSARPETSQMFGYVSAESPNHREILDRRNWLMTAGDRDV